MPTAHSPPRPQREKPRVGRPRATPDPTGQDWHHKLSRLVERKRKDRTDAQIAALAGVTPTFLGQVLKGRKAPNLLTLLAILKALPASLSELDRA